MIIQYSDQRIVLTAMRCWKGYCMGRPSAWLWVRWIDFVRVSNTVKEGMTNLPSYSESLEFRPHSIVTRHPGHMDFSDRQADVPKSSAIEGDNYDASPEPKCCNWLPGGFLRYHKELKIFLLRTSRTGLGTFSLQPLQVHGICLSWNLIDSTFAEPLNRLPLEKQLQNYQSKWPLGEAIR